MTLQPVTGITRRVKPNFKNYYYCSYCLLYIPKELAKWRKGAKLTLPYCPICGRRLRTKPRYRKPQHVTPVTTLEERTK